MMLGHVTHYVSGFFGRERQEDDTRPASPVNESDTTPIKAVGALKDQLPSLCKDRSVHSCAYVISRLHENLDSHDMKQIAKKAIEEEQPEVFNMVASKSPVNVDATMLTENQEKLKPDFIYGLTLAHNEGRLAPTLQSLFSAEKSSVKIMNEGQKPAFDTTALDSGAVVIQHEGELYSGEIQFRR